MRYTVAYCFPFRFAGLAGRVEVYPVGAYVTYGGIGAEIEAWRGPILHAIFVARLAYSNIRRDHSPECFCMRCREARVTSDNPHGLAFVDPDPDYVKRFETEYNAGEWKAED